MEISTLRQGKALKNVNGTINANVSDNKVPIEQINNIAIKNDGNTYDDMNGKPSYSEKELKESLDIVNALLKKHNSHAEYSMHDKFKNVIMIKFVDSDTGQVLQEVPPKKILDMIAEMCEMVGIMVDKKA